MSAAGSGSDGTVRVEQDGGLAVLVFDAPPLNLVTLEVIEGLERAVEEIERSAPRGLLVRAEGKVVSGGVDVNVFHGLAVEEARALWIRLLKVTNRVESLELPTVFAAHGLCLTALFELSLACDVVLAAESASFGLVEAVIGLTPAMGGTQRLAERAGPARAREFVYTGDRYDAATLERWNVVNRVLPDEGFADAAREFAQRLAQGPTRAHAATKRIVRAQLQGGTERADELTPEVAGGLFATNDLQRAVETFLSEGPGHASFEGA